MSHAFLTNAEYFGHQAGLQEGAWQEKHTIAKNLLLDGLSSQVIAKATGLSVEEVEALK